MLDTLRAPTNLDVKRYPAVRLSDPAGPGRPPPCGTAHNRSRTARTGDGERHGRRAARTANGAGDGGQRGDAPGGGARPCRRHSPGSVHPFVPEVSVAQAFASDAFFTATIGV